MVVFFSEKMRLLLFSLLIANGSFGRHGPYDEYLSFSVRLAMCPVERERDPLGCRASGLTPELPVHVVLVPPLLVPSLLVPPLLRFQALVPPLLRLQALVPILQRHRIAFAIFWIALGSFVFVRCGGYTNAPDCTRAGQRIVQSTLLLSFFLHATPQAYKHGRLSNS